MNNLFNDIPLTVDLNPETTTELETVLATGDGLRIQRIVSFGHRSPEGFWYDQPQNEWVTVLTGKGQIRFEDELLELSPGDHLMIHANRKHRVEWTSPEEPTIWLAVFYDALPTINVPLGNGTSWSQNP